MTAADSFVSRWTRLRRGAASERKAQPEAERLQPEVTISPDIEPSSGQQNQDVAGQSFDPTSPPSIEAITAETDIRIFLQRQVSPELVRAALRQAWVSDPAICDFIGIAESQWDFNDPSAIPGFGPLRGSEDMLAPSEQTSGACDKLAETFPEMPASVEQGPLAESAHELADPDPSAPPSLDVWSAADVDCSSGDGNREDRSIRSDRGAEETDPARNHRSHGSALPW